MDYWICSLLLLFSVTSISCEPSLPSSFTRYVRTGESSRRILRLSPPPADPGTQPLESRSYASLYDGAPQRSNDDENITESTFRIPMDSDGTRTRAS
ncbi:unnamed protein product, partial [Cyprideis torosa]